VVGGSGRSPALQPCPSPLLGAAFGSVRDGPGSPEAAAAGLGLHALNWAPRDGLGPPS